MKALFAATCVALLAVVGYYFAGEYAQARANAEARAKTEDAMNLLYRISGAPEGDTARLAQFCTNARTYAPMREAAKALGAEETCASARLLTVFGYKRRHLVVSRPF